MSSGAAAVAPREESVLIARPTVMAAHTNFDHRLTAVQQAFVVLRPEWYAFARTHIRLQELSGGFGDLGTFITLITIVASKGLVNFGTALLFSGIFNLLTAVWFDVPIAVQPMHAIAAHDDGRRRCHPRHVHTRVR